ncbi:FecR family protein [Thalassospira lucentensis]|uniref:FecR family protein n=1 Tax=Thalassospira lucentensis TaxID=168935 RepID=UPI003AA9D544
MQQHHVKTASSSLTISKRVRRLMVGGTLALTFSYAMPASADLNPEMAGVSAAVTGEVMLAKSPGEVGTLVESGMPVYLGDRIITSANAGMQILLLDETVFTIGPNSDVAIDEFVYDPATGDGRIVADMARGVLRFVTGKIPLNNPSSMDINLPVGSIGIRGTIGLIRSVSAEQANEIAPGSFDTTNPDMAGQPVFMAVNQGPGLSRNDTTSRPGAFAVSSQTGNSENVTGENFGVFVSENVVTEPARFPQQVATYDFSANLIRTASRSSDGGDSFAPSSSGATPAPVVNRQQAAQANNQTGATMASSLDVALAQVGATRPSSSSADETASILNNAASAKTATETSTDTAFAFDALRQVTSGSASTGNITVDGANVDYTFSSSVDFANRTISISFTDIQNDDTGFTGSAGFFDGSGNPTPFDYSGTTGKVSFSGDDFNYDPNCTTLGCSASATFKDAHNVDFNVSTTKYSSGSDGSATLTDN